MERKAWAKDKPLWGSENTEHVLEGGAQQLTCYRGTASPFCYLGHLGLRACPDHLMWQEGGLGPRALVLLVPCGHRTLIRLSALV